eukprot:1153316-Pelagomonas_calceolata.AAC.7
MGCKQGYKGTGQVQKRGQENFNLPGQNHKGNEAGDGMGCTDMLMRHSEMAPVIIDRRAIERHGDGAHCPVCDKSHTSTASALCTHSFMLFPGCYWAVPGHSAHE